MVASSRQPALPCPPAPKPPPPPVNTVAARPLRLDAQVGVSGADPLSAASAVQPSAHPEARARVQRRTKPQVSGSGPPPPRAPEACAHRPRAAVSPRLGERSGAGAESPALTCARGNRTRSALGCCVRAP